MAGPLGVRFRSAIERGLARRPLRTQEGSIARDTVRVRMGSPGGTHGELELWVYARDRTSLEMVFGFFELFTPDDVICKVIPAGDYPRSDQGASLQLNADRCLVGGGKQIALIHHGRVSASGSFSRARLCELMTELCPDEMQRAGIVDPTSWPLALGTTSDIRRCSIACSCTPTVSSKRSASSASSPRCRGSPVRMPR